MLDRMGTGGLTQSMLEAKLKEAVDKDHSAGVLEHFKAVGKSSETVRPSFALLSTVAAPCSLRCGRAAPCACVTQPAFVRPLEHSSSRLDSNTAFHPLCAVRFLRLCVKWEFEQA